MFVALVVSLFVCVLLPFGGLCLFGFVCVVCVWLWLMACVCHVVAVASILCGCGSCVELVLRVCCSCLEACGVPFCVLLWLSLFVVLLLFYFVCFVVLRVIFVHGVICGGVSRGFGC